MPPKVKITREKILSEAFELVRAEGEEALTTRALASRLTCSTQPIFSNFPNMDALRELVLHMAYDRYVERTFADMSCGKYPPYKASGMAYIAFAVEEPQLFRMLYMRDRTGEERIDDTPESEQIVGVIMESTGLSSALSHRLHEELWVLVHGLAVMYATGFEEYDENKASSMLTDVYQGVLSRFQQLQRSDTDD